MDAVPPTPKKPGWYWDPRELDYNLALRERWRREIMFLGPETFRLRRWDGLTWTADTLRNYTMRRGSPLPYFLGPTTRIHPLTPEQSRQNLRVWAVLMVLSTLVALVSALTR